MAPRNTATSVGITGCRVGAPGEAVVEPFVEQRDQLVAAGLLETVARDP